MDKLRMVPHENSASPGKSFLFILHFFFFNGVWHYPNIQWVWFNSDWHKEWEKGIKFIRYHLFAMDPKFKTCNKDSICHQFWKIAEVKLSKELKLTELH